MTVERLKLALPSGACRALKRLITHIIGAELRRRLETTRGIFAVLRGYEARYHDAVRRAGRLTFADVQRLLAPVVLTRLPLPARRSEGVADEFGESLELDDDGQLSLFATKPAAGETSEPDADERRLLLDFRLDAQIDHWLLDEFQDTSFGQWSILRNLIDEVVQDPEGRRSFFCVGDVKQAIYTWREGDPRLFREIFEHYNAASPDSIEERHLVESWRSGPPLIEMVNTVFGDAAVLHGLFPGPASATWNREWRAHRSAVPQRNGQAALLHATDERERWLVVERLLAELRPLERGLTCAVLVKKNDTAAALADYLRRQGIPAIAESDLHVAVDNPLGAALLALVQAAAHPGDTLAQEQVRMTPLGTALADHGLTTPEAVTRRVLGQIHVDGFERAMEFWLAELERRLASDDVFSRQRAREFAAAAGLFDATGSRDVGEFIAFMERHTIRPPESAAVVRVMTVHKSKGLGFDVVVVPDLQGNRIDERREGLAIQKAGDRSIEWILDLPPKLFYARDEVVAAHVARAEAEACYENMSLLYVALTRAKRALYVVTEPVAGTTSRNFPRWLAETLGEEPREIRVGAAVFTGAWSSGDPNWAAAIVPEPSAAAAPANRIVPISTAGTRSVRHVARRPSRQATHSVPAAALFAVDAGAAAEFGTALHALLAEVEWSAPTEAAAWAMRWRDRGEAPALVTAAAKCLAAAELARVWHRPSGRPEVWRERAFEIVLDGAWVTGVFDRVVIERGADSRATAATVYDFKTDAVEADADLLVHGRRYAEQLKVYRRVAAVLTALPIEAVKAEIVFTQVARRVNVHG